MADAIKAEEITTSDPTWALTEKVLEIHGGAQVADVHEVKVGARPDVFLLVEATKSFRAGLPQIIPSLEAPIHESPKASEYPGLKQTYRYVEGGLEGRDLRILILGAYTDFAIQQMGLAPAPEMKPHVAIWRMWPEIQRCGEEYRMNWRVAFVPVDDLRARERRAIG